MHLVDVNFSDVHGGSFMLLAAHRESQYQPSVNVPVAIRAERAWLAQGLEERFVEQSRLAISSTYAAVMAKVSQGHVVDAYGAAAKAVTRFSAAKITHEHVRQCFDDSPLKQGKFLPGSGIPIRSRDDAWSPLQGGPPDAVLLTAWNYERSFREREAAYLAGGGRFIR
jgi:methylation protein EvaC